MDKDSKSTKKKILSAVAIILALVIALIGVTQLLGKKDSFVNNDEEDESLEDFTCYATLYGKDYEYTDQIKTYLLMGIDYSTTDDENYHGGMADFLSVLVVNDTAKNYALIQFDRDTMTDVLMFTADGMSQETRKMQLCCAHWYGANEKEACENTATSVSNILGEITIDYYASLPITAIGKLNSLVGGVTLMVNGDFTNTDSGLVNGKVVTLTDQQAEIYVRNRMDVDDGTNIQRMRRQREYMDAFKNQFTEKAKTDSKFVLSSFDSMKEYLSTDINGNIVSKLANKLSKYESLGTFTFEGETKLGKALDDNIEHAEFYLDKNSVIETMIKLFNLKQVDE